MGKLHRGFESLPLRQESLLIFNNLSKKTKIITGIIILALIIIGGATYHYFTPKTIIACGVIPSGVDGKLQQSCAEWKCEKGFATIGVNQAVCMFGGAPILLRDLPPTEIP